MSTFLELCQSVATLSGTVSGDSTKPASVTNQTGRLFKVVTWTQKAWDRIQTDRSDWLFMRKEFTASLTIGTKRYTPAALSITDLAQWVTSESQVVSIYDPAIGQTDEGFLSEASFREWRQKWDTGVPDNNRPTDVAVSPSNELCFGAPPDKAYTVRGEYQRTPQALTANTDTPIMPARYHEAIVWRALMLMHGHDEGAFSYADAKSNYEDIMLDLRTAQLPRMTLNGPLA